MARCLGCYTLFWVLSSISSIYYYYTSITLFYSKGPSRHLLQNVLNNMREYYTRHCGGHTFKTCIQGCFKQEGIYYHTLLVGGQDEKMLLESISSSGVSEFCPTYDTKVRKVITHGHLCMCVHISRKLWPSLRECSLNIN